MTNSRLDFGTGLCNPRILVSFDHLIHLESSCRVVSLCELALRSPNVMTAELLERIMVAPLDPCIIGIVLLLAIYMGFLFMFMDVSERM